MNTEASATSALYSNVQAAVVMNAGSLVTHQAAVRLYIYIASNPQNYPNKGPFVIILTLQMKSSLCSMARGSDMVSSRAGKGIQVCFAPKCLLSATLNTEDMCR